MPKSRNEKIFITDGTEIGRLAVGELVRDVRNHPLTNDTSASYVRQGRLRECHCSCGVDRLIPESALATGRIQSCGCLRREMLDKARLDNLANVERRHLKSQIIAQIRYEQKRLKILQAVHVPLRNEKAIQEAMSSLRSLLARKGALSRKESYRETWQKTTKKIMDDKLLVDPGDD
jgi:hypothetical protein